MPEPHPARPYAPSPEGLTKLVEEFLRVMGLSVVGAGRREYVVMLSGVELLRKMTLDLMLEENRIAPAARGGALHRNIFLSDTQREALEAAPASVATQESVLDVNFYFAAVFLPRARRLCAELGAAWPLALEEATRRSLKAHLGRDLPPSAR